MNPQTIRTQLYYDVMEAVRIGNNYRQVLLRRTTNGYEIGVFEGEVKPSNRIASPVDPTKPSFESDVAGYFQFSDRQAAISEFDKICDEIEAEGFTPYVLQIHGV